MKKYKVAVIGLRMGDAWARAAFSNPDTVLSLVYDKLRKSVHETYRVVSDFFHVYLQNKKT